MLTHAVNIRTNKYDIYCGRGSEWGNPYIIGKDGDRGEVLQQYKKFLFDNPDIIIRARSILVNKRLGCYCKPKKCHCDLLAWFCNTKIHAIVGRQTYSNYEFVKSKLNTHKIKCVVSSCLDGVNLLVVKYCKENKIPIIEIKPDCDTYGKSIDPKYSRNIIEMCNECIIFGDDQLSGIKSIIQFIKQQSKKFYLYNT